MRHTLGWGVLGRVRRGGGSFSLDVSGLRVAFEVFSANKNTYKGVNGLVSFFFFFCTFSSSLNFLSIFFFFYFFFFFRFFVFFCLPLSLSLVLIFKGHRFENARLTACA